MIKQPAKRVIFGVAILGLGLVVFNSDSFRLEPVSRSASLLSESSSALDGPAVEVDGTVIPVEVADTVRERNQGLSGRESLEAGHGMLFVFPKAGLYRFWMPDMNFPIDIIWIADGKVIAIDANVSPEFDPQNPVHYVPSVPVTHVLETNAGFAEENGTRVGSSLTFHRIE